MVAKIKNRIVSLPWHQLRDVRFLGFIVFAVIVLLTSWSGVRVIETNYRLQRQISTIRQQNELKELENANLKLQNAYYESETFLELSARRQFGKGASGEKLILVPRSVALAYAPDIPTNDNQSNSIDTEGEDQGNFEAWMDFFFHRNSDS